jgi:hypothetical protein
VGKRNGSRMGFARADEALVVFSPVSYAAKGEGSDRFGLEISRENCISHRPKRKLDAAWVSRGTDPKASKMATGGIVGSEVVALVWVDDDVRGGHGVS